MMPSSTAASTAAASTATQTITTTSTTTNTAVSTAAAQSPNKMITPTSTYNSRVNNSTTASTNINTSSSASTMKTAATTATKSAPSSAQCSTAPVVSSVINKSNLASSSSQPNNPNSSHNKVGSNLIPTGPTMASVVSKKVNPISPSASSVQSTTTTAVTSASVTQSSNLSVTHTATTAAPTAVTQHATTTRVITNVPETKSATTSITTELHHTQPVATSSPSKNKTVITASSAAVDSTGAENNSGNCQSNSTNSSVIVPNAPKTSKFSVVNGSLSSDHSRASTDGHGTPSVDNISKTNLYIKGLQTTTNDQDLYEMCVRFGQISSTKAIIDKSTGCCRGYGFVEFTSPQAAEMAVHELTKEGVQAQMAKISPSYSTHSNNNSHHHHHSHHPTQYHHVNRGQMHHHHNSHHGQGNSNNNNTGGSGGTNNNSNSGQHQHPSGYNVTSAYQHNQNSSQGNSSGHNNSSHHNPDPTNLYIANLPPNMSEQELENLLSTYGPVVSTRILRDQNTNVPRGVGFARMESRDKCEQIIEQLNGRPCKGCQEPLLVKFADGGSKKRNYHNSLHHHNNSSHHRTQKSHQDDTRWRDSAAPVDLGGIPSFEHQSNISHSNHLTDLAMMGPMAYHARMPIFPPAMQAGSGYPNPMGPQTNAPPWLHPGGHSQPYVIPQPIIPPGGLTSSSQAATAAAMQYGHLPQLTSQMQGLQIAHPGAPVAGYLTPQHQWSQP